MARTPSNMIPLGTVAPDFRLPDTVSGKILSLQDLKSDKGTVIMFICNHCPFVIFIQNELVNLAKEYKQKGISFVAINSNDTVSYPDDAPDKMREVALKHSYPFPYLFDEDQKVAKSYDAACTPDFYVFDKNLQCVYRGQFDDARPGAELRPTGKDLKEALDCLLANRPLPSQQRPSLGCNIKWKK